MQVNQLTNLQCKVHRLPLSVVLDPVACPQSGNPREFFLCTEWLFHFIRPQYIVRSHRYFCCCLYMLFLTCILWITKDHSFSSNSSLLFYWRQKVNLHLKWPEGENINRNFSFLGELSFQGYYDGKIIFMHLRRPFAKTDLMKNRNVQYHSFIIIIILLQCHGV